MIAATADDVGSAELHRFEQIQHRLIATFCPPLASATVERSLDGLIDKYAAAPVRLYVPVLVERQAVEQLCSTAADGDS